MTDKKNILLKVSPEFHKELNKDYEISRCYG